MRGLIQAAAIALMVTSVPAAAKAGEPADVAAAVAAPGHGLPPMSSWTQAASRPNCSSSSASKRACG